VSGVAPMTVKWVEADELMGLGLGPRFSSIVLSALWFR
jgi:hypothetical protein